MNNKNNNLCLKLVGLRMVDYLCPYTVVNLNYVLIRVQLYNVRKALVVKDPHAIQQ